jgi:hypothetical protein
VRGHLPTKYQRYIAIILLATSDCPSDLGLNIEDLCSLTLANLKSSHQKIHVIEHRSQSLTMELGMP